MADGRDVVDIAGIEGTNAPGLSQPQAGAGRPWLSVVFRCARKYVRAYRNAAGTGYHARCPSCGRSVRFVVGTGGTRERFFEVRC
jgi:hypothetical protein